MNARTSGWKLAILVVSVLALVEGVLLVHRFYSAPTSSTTPAARDVAATVSRLPGQRLELDFLEPIGAANLQAEMEKGTVLVVLFDTGCRWCQEARPFLETLYEEGRVGIVAVSVESPAVLEAYGARFPMFSDREGRLPGRLGVPATPLFLVVRAGIIQAARLGWAPGQAETLRSLLSE